MARVLGIPLDQMKYVYLTGYEGKIETCSSGNLRIRPKSKSELAISGSDDTFCGKASFLSDKGNYADLSSSFQEQERL